ncbi:Rpn family recombination-promoting nuclease/putative transposase [Desulfovibrionales bacterium]
MGRKELAQDFLDTYLSPAVRRHMDLDTLSLCKDSFVSADKSTFYSDLLYKVATTSKQDAFIYLLFEHKSTPDRFTALQMLRYMVEIWEQYLDQHQATSSLPCIVPIVVYHGPSRQQGITMGELVNLPDADLKIYLPDFALDFLDFSPKTDRKIKGQILTQLFIHCLQAKNEPRAVHRLIEIFTLIAQLDDSATSMEWIRSIFIYINQVMDIDKDVVTKMTKLHLTAPKEDAIMTIAEQWRREGRMEGRMEGESELLRRLLAKRFGNSIFDIRVQERLRTATPEDFNRWADSILDAKTIEDVFSAQ